MNIVYGSQGRFAAADVEKSRSIVRLCLWVMAFLAIAVALYIAWGDYFSP